MSRNKPAGGMHQSGGTKTRGRHVTPEGASPSRPNVPQAMQREATRPVSSGSGKLRGDRRDMSPTYTTTRKHAARGDNLRADVKTRKR